MSLQAMLDTKPLLLLEQGRQAIAQAKATQDFRALKEMRDKAQAVCDYLMKQRETADDAAIDAAELTQRSGRAIGELVMQDRRGGSSMSAKGTLKYLPDGINHKLAHRCRLLARIPTADFEEYISECRKIRELITSTGAIRWYKAKQRKANIAAIAAEPAPLPKGPFRVIVVDPPWSYENRPADITHRAANPYPSMSVAEISALPLAELAAKDCIVWLWTTNAFMQLVFTVIGAWGFQQKTILTWVKDRMGVGDWLRGQTEHCLLCVRGKPQVNLTNQTTVLEGPVRKHSQKPEEFYELVEALCPGSKLEMFARQSRQGWAVHGNECDANECEFQRDDRHAQERETAL
jgi:N6-adenosine-specific RNA methylase IME4